MIYEQNGAFIIIGFYRESVIGRFVHLQLTCLTCTIATNHEVAVHSAVYFLNIAMNHIPIPLPGDVI